MEVFTVRSADAAFGLAAVFLFGIFAAASSLDIGVIFLCLCAVAATAIFYFPQLQSRALIALIAFIIFTFPLSVFYYHLRVPIANTTATTSASASASAFAQPATLNPLFAQAVVVFENTLPYRQASLLAGIVSGSKTVLTSDVKAAMTQSGTSYIIGMYGYKIFLLSETVRAACKKFFSRRIASLLALAAIIIFIAMADVPISALRAGIMAGLAMLAEAAGRKFNARIALMFTAALMVIFDPTVLVSGGFLLSFMSLVGIYALAPPFKVLLKTIVNHINRGGQGDDGSRGDNRDGFLGWKSHLVTTAAVNLAILPIVSIMYGDFPAISFLSNFLIAIPFGAVIALGIALAAIGSIYSAATLIVTPILNVLLAYQLLVVDVFSGVSWSVPAWFSSPITLGAYYCALVWFVFRRTPSTARKNISIKSSP